jgi:hypothetical protein
LLKTSTPVSDELFEISVGMWTGAVSGLPHLIKLNKTLPEVRHKFGIAKPFKVRKNRFNEFAYATLDAGLRIIFPDTIKAHGQLAKSVSFVTSESHVNKGIYYE